MFAGFGDNVEDEFIRLLLLLLLVCGVCGCEVGTLEMVDDWSFKLVAEFVVISTVVDVVSDLGSSGTKKGTAIMNYFLVFPFFKF